MSFPQPLISHSGNDLGLESNIMKEEEEGSISGYYGTWWNLLKEDQIPFSFQSVSISLLILMIGLVANFGLVLALFKCIFYFSPRPKNPSNSGKVGKKLGSSTLVRNSAVSNSIVFHTFLDRGKGFGKDKPEMEPSYRNDSRVGRFGIPLPDTRIQF